MQYTDLFHKGIAGANSPEVRSAGKTCGNDRAVRTPKMKKGGKMLKKLGRALITITGGAIGYLVCLLMWVVLEKSGYRISNVFTANQRIGVAVIFVFFFAIIFFKLAPIMGRQSFKVANNIESDLEGVSGNKILAGFIGLMMGFVIAFFVSQTVIFVINPYLRALINILLYIFFGFFGVVVASSKGSDLIAPVLSQRKQGQNQEQPKPFAKSRKKSGEIPKIIDTSVIIDGRIADIIRTGFLEGPIVIPEFVLVELRHIADSSDSLKRTRGRRGLDILKKIQTDYGVEIYNTDGEKSLKEIAEVDVKLLKLAQIMNGKVVTNDYNLNKVAAINDVSVLNINKLANCLKPIVLPGEEMVVHLVKQGKDNNQAIGYLDDGTMIVAEDGRKMIGKTTKLTVTSVLQTSAGKMIFGRLKV